MKYIEDFNKYVKEIKDKHDKLFEQLSNVDSEQEDVLHFLELTTCDAVTMMKATKRLKEIRKRRREIKDELAAIQKVHARLGNAVLSHTNPDIYTCRTDILNGISTRHPVVTKIVRGKLIYAKEKNDK